MSLKVEWIDDFPKYEDSTKTEYEFSSIDLQLKIEDSGSFSVTPTMTIILPGRTSIPDNLAVVVWEGTDLLFVGVSIYSESTIDVRANTLTITYYSFESELTRFIQSDFVQQATGKIHTGGCMSGLGHEYAFTHGLYSNWARTGEGRSRDEDLGDGVLWTDIIRDGSYYRQISLFSFYGYTVNRVETFLNYLYVQGSTSTQINLRVDPEYNSAYPSRALLNMQKFNHGGYTTFPTSLASTILNQFDLGNSTPNWTDKQFFEKIDTWFNARIYLKPKIWDFNGKDFIGFDIYLLPNHATGIISGNVSSFSVLNTLVKTIDRRPWQGYDVEGVGIQFNSDSSDNQSWDTTDYEKYFDDTKYSEEEINFEDATGFATEYLQQIIVNPPAGLNFWKIFEVNSVPILPSQIFPDYMYLLLNGQTTEPYPVLVVHDWYGGNPNAHNTTHYSGLTAADRDEIFHINSIDKDNFVEEVLNPQTVDYETITFEAEPGELTIYNTFTNPFDGEEYYVTSANYILERETFFVKITAKRLVGVDITYYTNTNLPPAYTALDQDIQYSDNP